MYSSDLADGRPQLEKKLSREEKKILDAIARMEKSEAARMEIKAKAHQKETMISSKPRKQPKIQINPSTEPISNQSPKQEGPTLSAEDADKALSEEKDEEPQNVINPDYKLTNSDDLFMHLIEYREAEREKFIQKSEKSLAGMPYLLNKEGIKMMSEDLLHETTKAFSRIQAKFEENRSKLKKPNSKEHKQFQLRYLNGDFLEN